MIKFIILCPYQLIYSNTQSDAHRARRAEAVYTRMVAIADTAADCPYKLYYIHERICHSYVSEFTDLRKAVCLFLFPMGGA